MVPLPARLSLHTASPEGGASGGEAEQELLQLSQQILGLTDEIHKLTVAQAAGKESTAQPLMSERVS
jgi:hypothetical protein